MGFGRLKYLANTLNLTPKAGTQFTADTYRQDSGKTAKDIVNMFESIGKRIQIKENLNKLHFTSVVSLKET